MSCLLPQLITTRQRLKVQESMGFACGVEWHGPSPSGWCELSAVYKQPVFMMAERGEPPNFPSTKTDKVAVWEHFWLWIIRDGHHDEDGQTWSSSNQLLSQTNTVLFFFFFYMNVHYHVIILIRSIFLGKQQQKMHFFPPTMHLVSDGDIFAQTCHAVRTSYQPMPNPGWVIAVTRVLRFLNPVCLWKSLINTLY